MPHKSKVRKQACIALHHIQQSCTQHLELSRAFFLSQVNVPTAQMEEILPAARLLSRATSPTPSDYGRAKAAFIQGVHEVSLQAKVILTLSWRSCSGLIQAHKLITAHPLLAWLLATLRASYTLTDLKELAQCKLSLS